MLFANFKNEYTNWLGLLYGYSNYLFWSFSFNVDSGFTDILLVNPDYRLIPGENNRFFPTSQKSISLPRLKNNIVNIKTDNIALLNKDYGQWTTIRKTYGFCGYSL